MFTFEISTCASIPIFHLMVLSKGFGEDQDVHVTDGHPLAHKVREDIIHHGLECGQGVAKAEEHYLGLIQPLVCGKCSLPLVSFLDLDIVETPLEVQSTPFKLDMGQLMDGHRAQ